MSPLLPLLISLTLSAPDDKEFQAFIRTSEPLSALEEQGKFHLPPGFEIQLFASEPEIQKPMNMSFDAVGRLWVSGSVEYPYAAADGQGQDAIKVLADTDGDGRADRISTFVDGLNIPIGLYPYRDGVVAYSIPNIWFFRDTDHDGKADRREILYGPLGTPRDTHGMQNAFRRGFDGWLYINHGFANESTIAGRDGSQITLQSGNTYRVRLDGSRVEQYTWGQVNPFGSTFLPNGDLITADCHSRPLTLLQRGAYYPSFGKPHDGLGFAPNLMEHSHGSTAIAGAAYYTGDQFPPAYHGHLFTGNVMTCRVNHDVLRYKGATPNADEQADFVVCDDPWFRPVDLQIGPDGALYVADFYNRVIGHYEVALEHPGRDRNRGRIWRIVYRGDAAKAPVKSFDLTRAKVDPLIAELANPSLTRRMLATDQLSDRIGESGVTRLTDAALYDGNETVRAHSMWVLHRLGRLTEENVLQLSVDPSELVRIHAMRALTESPEWKVNAAARLGKEVSPHVRRMAADAAARQIPLAAKELLTALADTPPQDVLLRHALRLAVRNQFRSADAWPSIRRATLAQNQLDLLSEIATAVPTSDAAEFVLENIRARGISSPHFENQLIHVCTHLPAERLNEVVKMAQSKSQDNIDLQIRLLSLMLPRVQMRQPNQVNLINAWGEELTKRLLDPNYGSLEGWRTQAGDAMWGLEPRNCEDGQRGVMFLSSLPRGERAVSVLRSAKLQIPTKLSFYVCGHLGMPGKPAVEKSAVRLRLVDTGKLIQQVFPPRSDTARRVEWDLSAHAGQQGYLEIVDDLDLSAYAWLAIARFEPPVLSLPAVNPSISDAHKEAACLTVATLKLESQRPTVRQLMLDDGKSWQLRAVAAHAELAFSQRPVLAALTKMIPVPFLDNQIRSAICRQVSEGNTEAPIKLLVDVMRLVPAETQRHLADALSSTPEGAESLVTIIEQGHAAPRLLQDATISQKLAASRAAGLGERVANLVSKLPPPNEQIQKLIEQRRRAFNESAANVGRGQELYRKNCLACHQIGGQGTLIGPQLDGVGNRGAERVIEDVLDPNRNIDATFHVNVYALSSGQVVTGLFRRDDGTSVILANQEGKEITISKSEIDEQTKSNTSLMPANFGDVLNPTEFRDLIGYLLTLRPKQ